MNDAYLIVAFSTPVVLIGVLLLVARAWRYDYSRGRAEGAAWPAAFGGDVGASAPACGDGGGSAACGAGGGDGGGGG